MFPSLTLGICISEPLDVTVRKEFFIDLRLPYAAVRGEQIKVKAILHNLSPDDITVSLADSSGPSWHRQRKSVILPLLLDTFSHDQHLISDIELCQITQVRVELLEGSDICSSAFRRGKYRQEMNVDARTKRVVPFIIIPMRSGDFPIEVQAAVKDSVLNDGVQKMLRVVVREENL